MSQLLAKNISNVTPKTTKNLSVVETGLFVSCENSVFGALPDRIVSCECHESGLLEVKCPWTHRDKSVIDYAKLEESCFEVADDKIALKKSHSHDYQVQMQLAVIRYSWCDFFSMHDKRLLSAENIFWWIILVSK